MASPMQTTERFYAVAVRDTELYLELRIRRADSGVYVVFERPPKQIGPRKWNPHASYHKDGWRHQKSFREEWFKEQRQPLDNNFRGTEQVVATPLMSGSSNGTKCNPQDFSDVLEIPLADVRPDCCTSVSVDLTEPGVQPTLLPGAVIVQQKVFNGWVPCLVVTVYELPAAVTQTG